MSNKFNIPSELIQMISERRVIPFIGAGFSSPFKLPAWEDLLRQISLEISDDITFDQVKSFCSGDLLQVAEYYYLKSDNDIGPMRHAITTSLNTNVSCFSSGAHIELINLGAQQIYTTNYDDLVEKTYRCLDRAVDVIALPKNVATSDGKKTQIVKFHGDLRYENTLVLTESSYFSRLDLESPMDIKFRSDLLGRSVLFMGYSFRDINIRIIWFKLMEMMKDIPADSRPKSYIVTFSPNVVLEKLYESVGIKTIVLDPANRSLTGDEMTEMFADFMLELTVKSSQIGQIPGEQNAQYFSKSLFTRLRNQLTQFKSSIEIGQMAIGSTIEILEVTIKRDVPKGLEKEALEILVEISESSYFRKYSTIYALYLLDKFGMKDQVVIALLRGIRDKEAREKLFEVKNFPWEVLWAKKIPKKYAEAFLLELQRDFNFPWVNAENLAYLIDLVARVKFGYSIEDDKELQLRAENLLNDTSKMYKGVNDYVPSKNGKPNLEKVINEIKAFETDLPF